MQVYAIYKQTKQNKMQNTVSERIKFLRQHHGLSKTDLAKKIGLSPQSIVSLENRGTASEATLKKVAEATGTNVQWIVSGIGEPFTTNNNNTTQSASNWKDTAFDAIRSENNHLRDEVMYLREMLKQALTGRTANFPEPSISPELPTYRKLHIVGAELGASAAA
jgi:transcriptional regulator with XRE-family HTH domain